MRRVHRLTPLLRFWTLILALLAVFVANLNEAVFGRLRGVLAGDVPVKLLVGFVALCVAVFVVSQVWWAATGFRLDDEELRHQHGVFSKHLRTARYDRVQAVDVVEPLIARLFRLAAVRVETAGGGSSAIEIAYLPRAEAHRLRTEILARVRGEGVVDKQEERYVIEPIPIWRSLTGTALRGTTLVGAVWIALALLSPLTPATVIPLLVGFVPPVWNMVNRSWRFNARLDSDNVLHLAYGLASRRSQAVPLARIHGVSVVQPMLWRPLGWWSVSVSVAGYGRESNKSTGTTRILPVGSWDQAMRVVELAGGVTDYRAEPTYRSPRRARLVSPLDAHRQSVTLRDNVAVVQSGLFVRRIAMIDFSHIQELSLRRGPLQSLLGLATVRFDLVPGPVSMAARDLDADDARALVDVLRARKLPELRMAA